MNTFAKYFLLGLIVSITLIAACNTNPERSTNPDLFFGGLVVVDPNLELSPSDRSAKIVARLSTADSAVSDATIIFGNDTLTYSELSYNLSSVYSFENNDTYNWTSKSFALSLQYNGTIELDIPVADSFSITNVVPGNHQVQALEQVSIEWSGSDSADSYIVATVLVDSAYTGYGYSAFSIDAGRAATFPPEAFAMGDGETPEVGLYYIAVYAITGSPDSLAAQHLLPVPLPSIYNITDFSDNVAGFFGSITVTLFDTIRVSVQ